MKVHERVLIAGAEGLLGRYFTAQLFGRCSLSAHNHASLDITSEQLGFAPMRHWTLALADYFDEGN